MNTTHQLSMDLAKRGAAPRVDAVQDDRYSRNLQFLLYESGQTWQIPASATAVVRYRKPDGTGGEYDLLPNGSTAYSISGNSLTVALAPQVCTVPGIVQLSVCLRSGESEISTFAVFVNVERKPGFSAESEDYHKLQGILPSSGWTPNMYLGTDAQGNVVEKSAPSAGAADGSCDCGTVSFDQNVKSINHRGYSAEAPENTVPAYVLSRQKGFTYVEADVSFTSDGVAVLLHDSTIDRTSDGSGSISGMSYEEAAQYDYGSWKSSAYAGTKIPTFSEFIATCKALCLHPYIELKSNGAYTQEQIEGIIAAVKAHGMQGKVTYISFSSAYLEYVKAADPKARLGFLVSTLSASSITTAQSLMSGENEVFLDAKLANLTDALVDLCINADIPLEVWTVNDESSVENMNPYISGVTSDSLIAGKVLFDKYMVYTEPSEEDVPATAVSLSASSLTFDSTVRKSLTATVTPSDTTDTVVWSSSNNAVASVNGGVVTPVANGTAVITATAGAVSAVCSVTVEFEEAVNTYTVTNKLTNVVNSNSATTVTEGVAYSATLTVSDGYTLDSVSVTMGGVNITASAYSGGAVSIAAVTGNVIITAAAVKTAEDVQIPEGSVINLALSSYDGSGTITNGGSGGSAYNATVSGSPTAAADALILATTDYFTVPRQLTPDTSWTWFVCAYIGEQSTQKYQRVMRGTNDVPSVYYSTNYLQYGVKLTNSATSLTPTQMGTYGLANTAGGTYNFGFVCDGTNITIYINGVKYISEAASIMSDNSKQPDAIGCGDTGSQGYYFNALHVRSFLVYDRALSESEMSLLHTATV